MATVAFSLVDSESIAEIAGNTQVSAAGNVDVTAQQKVFVDTVSSGYLVGETGGGIAVAGALVDSTTYAGITDSADITGAANVTIATGAVNEVNTSAESAINDGGGALQDTVTGLGDDGGNGAGYISDAEANEITTMIGKADEMRSDGGGGSSGPQVAGAFAYTDLDADTQAYVGHPDDADHAALSSDATVTTGGRLTVSTKSLSTAMNLASGLASGGSPSIGRAWRTTLPMSMSATGGKSAACKRMKTALS